MIEISHKQAQRLIRQKIDGPIPDEQWAVLQAHLEGCEECRAYQAGLAGSERVMRRVLRLRWSPVHGPSSPLEGAVKRRRTMRAQVRRYLGYAGFAAMVVFLGMLYAGYRRATAPPPTPTPDLAAIGRITPSPAAPRTTFRGVAAFVTEELGSPEIFLLNPGVGGEENELVNMTNNPAADFDPAWSPDGEWLAFISDRTGKNEVFVMHIAGSRLTQLTNDAEVDWHGPLTWSPDGAWVALTGTPLNSTGAVDADVIDDAWVYLLPVSGEEQANGPRRLSLTRGVTGRTRFSPADPLLAYPIPDRPGSSIMVYDIDDGMFIPVTYSDNNEGMLRTGIDSAFDWSDDGRLAYLAEGPVDPDTGAFTGTSGIQVRTTLPPAQFGGGSFDSRSNQLVESLPETSALRQVAYVPGRESRGQMVAYLRDEDGDDCWTVQLHFSQERDSRPRNLAGLCVDGTIGRESFTPDGRWLVTIGHLPDETEAAMFALRIPNDLISTGGELVERLADVTVAADVRPPQPVIRPAGELLSIAPKAAPSAQSGPPPTAPPRGTRGQVVYSFIQNQPFHPLVRMRPYGGDTRTYPVDAKPGENLYRCPAFSPDGKQIAFVSDRESGRDGLMEVFVMDANGQNARRLARNVFARSSSDSGESPPAYDCPVWSPDGTRLASILRTGIDYRLALIPIEEEAAVTYLPVAQTSFLTRPVWSPDGTHILLTHNRDGQTPPRMDSIDLGDGGETPTIRTLVESDGWGDIYGMAYSPNGTMIAYVVAYYRINQPSSFQLRLMDLTGNNRRNVGTLPESSMNFWLGTNPLEWGEDNRLSFISRGRPHDKVKSHFFMVDLTRLDAVGIFTIAELDEVVFDTAWSPDRRWVMFATEGGLVAQDVEGALSGEAGPAKINGDRVYEVDWR